MLDSLPRRALSSLPADASVVLLQGASGTVSAD